MDFIAPGAAVTSLKLYGARRPRQIARWLFRHGDAIPGGRAAHGCVPRPPESADRLRKPGRGARLTHLSYGDKLTRMSSVPQLLTLVLEAARQADMDQLGLAAAAGVAPETLSRAKKRGTIDLATLQALASVVGLSLSLESAAAADPPGPPSRRARKMTVAGRAALSHPSRGLAWSNPAVSDEVLVRNALKRGSFHLLLDATLGYGLPFVREQWDLIRSDVGLGLSGRTQTEIARKLDNIERGLRDAQAGH